MGAARRFHAGPQRRPRAGRGAEDGTGLDDVHGPGPQGGGGLQRLLLAVPRRRAVRDHALRQRVWQSFVHRPHPEPPGRDHRPRPCKPAKGQVPPRRLHVLARRRQALVRRRLQPADGVLRRVRHVPPDGVWDVGHGIYFGHGDGGDEDFGCERDNYHRLQLARRMDGARPARRAHGRVLHGLLLQRRGLLQHHRHGARHGVDPVHVLPAVQGPDGRHGPARPVRQPQVRRRAAVAGDAPRLSRGRDLRRRTQIA
mmetsp:Transcript_7072/g.22970  ORF Transcript_7072/g.22970 Transcript_7072/m.22970 type:complete len:255 (+) Transcript_7072:161-925(+)